LKRAQLKGLIIPLVTPMYHGKFDAESMTSLLNTLEKSVDAYVPCLSTGEGAIMSSDLWHETMRAVTAKANKPVIAGIRKRSYDEVRSLAESAKKYGCKAIIVPPLTNDDGETVEYIRQLSANVELPVIVYSVPETPISSVECLKAIDQMENVIGIKDSSGNLPLFKNFMQLKAQGQISLALLQGLETNMWACRGCDGFLVSLLHLEPELCGRLLREPTAEAASEMQNCAWKYNLDGEWYATIKAFLCARSTIRSAEQVAAPGKIQKAAQPVSMAGAV
jgi:4-hydroxy-tetrahydrodipicolinate synthase